MGTGRVPCTYKHGTAGAEHGAFLRAVLDANIYLVLSKFKHILALSTKVGKILSRRMGSLFYCTFFKTCDVEDILICEATGTPTRHVIDVPSPERQISVPC